MRKRALSKSKSPQLSPVTLVSRLSFTKNFINEKANTIAQQISIEEITRIDFCLVFIYIKDTCIKKSSTLMNRINMEYPIPTILAVLLGAKFKTVASSRQIIVSCARSVILKFPTIMRVAVDGLSRFATDNMERG